jgi:hypothetical protein
VELGVVILTSKTHDIGMAVIWKHSGLDISYAGSARLEHSRIGFQKEKWFTITKAGKDRWSTESERVRLTNSTKRR